MLQVGALDNPVAVEYARVDILREYRSLLPYAFACGILPLSFGILVFLIWYFTRHQSLMLAGVWTFVIGLLLFFAGCIFLLTHVALNWWFLTRSEDRFRYRRAVGLAAALLISNFPACLIIMMLVDSVRWKL